MIHCCALPDCPPPLYTAWHDSLGGHIWYLVFHTLTCPDNQAISNYKLEKNYINGQIRYKYQCCPIAPDSIRGVFVAKTGKPSWTPTSTSLPTTWTGRLRGVLAPINSRPSQMNRRRRQSLMEANRHSFRLFQAPNYLRRHSSIDGKALVQIKSQTPHQAKQGNNPRYPRRR